MFVPDSVEGTIRQVYLSSAVRAKRQPPLANLNRDANRARFLTVGAVRAHDDLRLVLGYAGLHEVRREHVPDQVHQRVHGRDVARGTVLRLLAVLLAPRLDRDDQNYTCGGNGLGQCRRKLWASFKSGFYSS